MSIQQTCPGCGKTENLPDALRGKKLKCKRCQHTFVVGGAATPAASPKADFPFGGERPAPAPRRRPKGSAALVALLFLGGFLAGGGAVAGYLYFNKPPADEPDDSAKTDSPTPAGKGPRFAWVIEADPNRKTKDDADGPPGGKDKGPKRDPMGDPPRVEVPRGETTLDSWKKIKQGMTEAEVVKILGPPSQTKAVPEFPDTQEEDWSVEGKGVTLVFQKGALGWCNGSLRMPGEMRPVDDQKIDEALRGLKLPDAVTRRLKAQELGNLRGDLNRLDEVSRALEEAARDGDPLLRAAVVSALKNWATRGNADFLLQIATAEVRMGDVGNPLFQAKPQALELLARLKDPRALEPALKMLDDFSYGRSAALALKALGPVLGKKEVLKRLHTGSTGGRGAREILKAYKTPDAVVIAQTVQDLKSSQEQVKAAALATALEWPVVPEYRKEVAQATEQYLLQRFADFGDVRTVQVLKKWGGPDNLPTFRKYLNSPVPDVKRLAQEAIDAIEMRK